MKRLRESFSPLAEELTCFDGQLQTVLTHSNPYAGLKTEPIVCGVYTKPFLAITDIFIHLRPTWVFSRLYSLRCVRSRDFSRPTLYLNIYLWGVLSIKKILYACNQV